MNSANLKLAAALIDHTYVEMGEESLKSREKQVKVLLSHRRIPEEGWDDLSIDKFLNELAMMDTNNFPGKVGIGERESRIFSPLVQKRHFYLGHGIGRSGEINAVQPKAAGSSLITKLTRALTYDALKIMCYDHVEDLILLPLATGMSLTMILLAAASERPEAKYVIWPRIDQKTCLKCITAANLIPVVAEMLLEGDALRTDVSSIEEKIISLGGKSKVLAILTTTSCFAPRTPDKIEEVAAICRTHDVFHIINNAYGLQCSKIANSINQGSKHGRVDAVVQSTDKNFLVPVGGSIVFSPKKKGLVDKVSSNYPGRASASSIVDLFITFLSMGRKGLSRLLKERKENAVYMKDKLSALAVRQGERVLHIPENSISFAITLSKLQQKLIDEGKPPSDIIALGSTLFHKRVMGARVAATCGTKEVAGLKFINYGSHSDKYPYLPYLTAAVALGMTRDEVDIFLHKLEKSMEELRKASPKPTPTTGPENKLNSTLEGGDQKPEEGKQEEMLQISRHAD